MTSRRPYCFLLLAIGAFPMVGIGCDRKDQIETYTVPKTLAVASEPIADSGDTVGGPKWTVPEGWTFVPGRDMRFASFVVSREHPEVELTVVPLGSAGGTLLDNVHRWQKQLGLEPSPSEDLKKIMTSADLSGTPAGLFDLTGVIPADGKPQQRMLAAIVPQPTQTWFFKLAGPVDVVSAQKDNFDHFIHSLKFEPAPQEAASHVPPADASNAPPAAAQSPIKYSVPPGWTEQAERNLFRVVAFDIPVGSERGAAIVARMPANSGSILDNVNRWRDQVGLSPLPDIAQASSQPLKIGGLDAMMWEIQGVSQAQTSAGGIRESQPGATVPQSITVAMLTRGSEWWFFKLQGPATIVSAQKEPFLAFLRSVQFTGDAQ